MARKKAGRRFPPGGYCTLPKSRSSALKEIGERHNFRENARRIIDLCELSSEKSESRAILRHSLQATFLKSLTVRTIAEEQCMKLAEAVARIEDTTSRFKPEKISFSRGLKLYNAMLFITETWVAWHRKNPAQIKKLEQRASGLKESIAVIKQAIANKSSGSMNVVGYPDFSQISFFGGEMVRELRNSKGFSEYAKIGFEEIDRIIKEDLGRRRP